MQDTIITTTRVNVARLTHSERTSYDDCDRYAELDALSENREQVNESSSIYTRMKRACTLNAIKHYAVYDFEDC
jgi:hypothetical protein